jgi:hypothetical protein
MRDPDITPEMLAAVKRAMNPLRGVRGTQRIAYLIEMAGQPDKNRDHQKPRWPRRFKTLMRKRRAQRAALASVHPFPDAEASY